MAVYSVVGVAMATGVLCIVTSVSCVVLPCNTNLCQYAALEEGMKAEINAVTQQGGSVPHAVRKVQTTLQSGKLGLLQGYVGNPVTVYKMLKRLTNFAQVMYQHLDDLESDRLVKMYNLLDPFTDGDNLLAISQALFRLQDTYNLTAHQLAHSHIPGVQYTDSLTAGDCFDLGVVSVEDEDYYHAISWLSESLAILDTEATETQDRVELLDYLSFAMYLRGNGRGAYDLTKQLLQIDPDNPRAANLPEYERLIREAEEEKPVTFHSPFVNVPNPRKYRSYERLCRAAMTEDRPHYKPLHCTVRHVPMFYLAPLKEELINVSPDITVYHDVLSEAEMSQMSAVKDGSLVAPQVAAKDHQPSNTQTSHIVFYPDTASPHVASMSSKVSDIVGLSLSSAEALQLENYGVGAHYWPHYDYVGHSHRAREALMGFGDRIASVMCYVNTAAAGGQLVFPAAHTVVPNTRGACVRWYNLKRSGDNDRLTVHGTCPVLAGTQWIVNKWFHEADHQFSRPCTLSQDD